jgi:hypothetical protein
MRPWEHSFLKISQSYIAGLNNVVWWGSVGILRSSRTLAIGRISRVGCVIYYLGSFVVLTEFYRELQIESVVQSFLRELLYDISEYGLHLPTIFVCFGLCFELYLR